VLHTDTRLGAADKELIAAFVSGLTACQYCYGLHAETASAFGVQPRLIEALVDDFEHAPVDSRLRPLLAVARKLTLTPARTTQADVDAVLAAGWSERDLHDAVLTMCLFNFMNRLLEGHGVKARRTSTASAAARFTNRDMHRCCAGLRGWGTNKRLSRCRNGGDAMRGTLKGRRTPVTPGAAAARCRRR
jgi:AhpD family alkylhydroperoxidase